MLGKNKTKQGGALYFGNFTVFDFLPTKSDPETIKVVKAKFVPFTFGQIGWQKGTQNKPIMRLFFDEVGSAVMKWLSSYLEKVGEFGQIFFFYDQGLPIFQLYIQIDHFPFESFSKEFGLKPQRKAVLGKVEFSASIKKKIHGHQLEIVDIFKKNRVFPVTVGQFNPRNMVITKEHITEIPAQVAEVVKEVH